MKPFKIHNHKYLLLELKCFVSKIELNFVKTTWKESVCHCQKIRRNINCENSGNDEWYSRIPKHFWPFHFTDFLFLLQIKCCNLKENQSDVLIKRSIDIFWRKIAFVFNWLYQKYFQDWFFYSYPFMIWQENILRTGS